VHEFISTDRDPHVRGCLSRRTIDRVEEDEVTRAKVRGIHIGPCVELLGDSARHVDAILIEHVPDEAAAIETGRIVATIFVRRTSEEECRT
jgi:hypothetical protein